LVEDGVLLPETHVALSAVGAIPYYSNLRVLDRLGLTDAVVAKSAPGELRVMAHDRHATLEYAASSGVDFWTEHPVHLLTSIVDDNLVWRLEAAREARSAVYFADTGAGEYLVAELPQGLAKTSLRFPRLTFHAASDDMAYSELLDAVIDARRRQLQINPSARDVRVSLGCALAARGRDDDAFPIFRALADAGDADGWYNLGTVLARRRQFAEAADAFQRALAVDPSLGPARHNLGLALVRAGRLEEGIVALRAAVQLEPDSERAIYTLGAALLVAGDKAGAGECLRTLEAVGTVDGDSLARRLRDSGVTVPPRLP
jgi:tetratricopeptide (TPR) repeat protein